LLLLCSDGLSDALDLEEIQDVLSRQFIKTGDKGEFLVEKAAERKSDVGDNITVIIIEY
jgi:serine/threonine protein phosphatase PrpC